MAQVNPLTREVLIKLVYYGPGLGGKTTTLQKIHSASPPETRGKIVSLATPVDRTLYFDFMPLRVGPVHGFPVRLQLFTVPGQVYFNATRKLVLTNADGVIFVADSQRERQDANLESLQNLAANLAEQDRTLAQVPHVLQYNKRDLSNLVSVEDLNQTLNQLAAPFFESSASRGLGVLEPLDELVRLVLLDLEKRAVFGHDVSATSEHAPQFGATQEGLRESVSRASEDWNTPPSEPAPLPAGAPSLGTLGLQKRTLPPCYSAPPRSQAFSVPAAARVPSLQSMASPQASAANQPPLPAPPAIPLPAGVRFQSVEPPSPEKARVREMVSATEENEPPSFSWAGAFAIDQRPQVKAIEQALAACDLRSALLGIESVCSDILTQSAEQHGLNGEGGKPWFTALALGFDGPRWRVLQRTVHRAQQDLGLTESEALDAFALLIELNRLHRASVV